jgi:RNA polymerase sigma factor (sigma-70 family)
MTDRQLLEQYRERKSQEAFGELVRRHIGWVRSAALRQVRDAHLADDVAQAVFLALARQAHRLHDGAALSTWLFQVTRYAASAALRGESRRRRHERNAAMLSTQRDEASSMTPQQWEQLSRMLDDLVARLRRDDRRAVLLRFYEQKSYPEMAAALGVSAEAARKRTDRAVEKLRQLAGRRDLALSAETLSAGLLAQAASPAPPAVTAAAIEAATSGNAAAGAAGTPTAAIAEGAIRMMNLMKMRIPVATTAAAAAAATAALIAVVVTTWDGGANAIAATQAASRPAPAAVASSAPATTAPAAREDSPKAVVFAAFRAAAAGDADGLIGRFDRITPAQEQTLRQAADVMSAARRLSDAVKQQFGLDVGQTLDRSVGMGVGEFDVTAAMETIQGDSAIVEMKAGPGDIRLMRVGQQWKISGDALRTLNPGALKPLHARVPAIDRLTADVRAGKYKTVDELRQAVGGLMQASRRPVTQPRPETRPAGQGR